jgi:cytoskeleton protein RodZ
MAANTNGVNEILRAAREERGIDLGSIAEMLKIRRVYLEAIENNDWDNLPELVYAQGFVRSYATFLNLDEQLLSTQFKREFRGGRRTTELEMPQPIDDNQLPSFRIIAAALIGMFLIYSFWQMAKPDQKIETVPTVSQNTETTATNESSTNDTVKTTAETTAADTSQNPAETAPTATTPTAAESAPPNNTPPQTGIAYGATTATRVTLTAVQDTWVQIRANDGQTVFSRVMRPGDSFRVPDSGALTLTTGNLAGLYFTVDGNNETTKATPGTVLRNLPLTPTELLPTLNKLTQNTPAAAAPTDVTQ